MVKTTYWTEQAQGVGGWKVDNVETIHIALNPLLSLNECKVNFYFKHTEITYNFTKKFVSYAIETYR